MNLTHFLYLSRLLPFVIVISEASRAHGRSTGALGALLSLTPHGNTGSNCQIQNGTVLDPSLYLSIDWLTFTLPIHSLDEVMDFIGECSHLFRDSVTVDEEKGFMCGKYYASSGRSARGALFTWNLPKEGPTGDLRVSLPSKALSECRQDEIWAYIRSLFEQGAKFTRIDVAIDDYSKSIQPETVVEAHSDQNFARFRKFRPIVEYSSGILAGWTLYLGSRGSESCVRYYDKCAESKGQIDCYRWEAEFRDDKAQDVCSKLSFIPTSAMHKLAPKLLSACLMGCIDFPDREGKKKRLDRCKPLPWWKEFCDRVGQRLRVVVRRTPSTLQQTKAWCKRSVFGAVSAVVDLLTYQASDSYANAWLLDGIAEARKNRTPQMEARLRSAKLGNILDLYDKLKPYEITEVIA